MSNTVTVEKAAAGLQALIDSLGPEDEIVLTRDELPVARIVSERKRPKALKKRVSGLMKGKLVCISDDDDHLDHFRDYMPK